MSATSQYARLGCWTENTGSYDASVLRCTGSSRAERFATAVRNPNCNCYRSRCTKHVRGKRSQPPQSHHGSALMEVVARRTIGPSEYSTQYVVVLSTSSGEVLIGIVGDTLGRTKDAAGCLRPQYPAATFTHHHRPDVERSLSLRYCDALCVMTRCQTSQRRWQRV